MLCRSPFPHLIPAQFLLNSTTIWLPVISVAGAIEINDISCPQREVSKCIIDLPEPSSYAARPRKQSPFLLPGTVSGSQARLPFHLSGPVSPRFTCKRATAPASQRSRSSCSRFCANVTPLQAPEMSLYVQATTIMKGTHLEMYITNANGIKHLFGLHHKLFVVFLCVCSVGGLLRYQIWWPWKKCKDIGWWVTCRGRTSCPSPLSLPFPWLLVERAGNTWCLPITVASSSRLR